MPRKHKTHEASEKREGSGKTRKRNIERNLLALNTVLLIVIIAQLAALGPLAQSGTGGGTDTETAAPDNSIAASGNVMGNPDAPVTIIEYSDFQCPFCGRFFQQTLPLIKENYIKTGKAKLEYKHFPLSFHQYAQKAAEAAECAGEQGKFWEMHDKIFENQQALDTESLKSYARDIGLNGDQFDSCLDSGKYASKVQQDFNDGREAGVSGTPTLFVNGQKIVGAQPFETFKNAIEAELAKQ